MMRLRKGSLLTGIGMALILAAFALTAYNLWDDARASAAVDHAVTQLAAVSLPEAAPAPLSPEPAIYELNPEMEMPVEQVEEWEYIGTIAFPQRDIVLPVISDWSYPALKVSPCRYYGSAYTGDLILSAHNYRSHFGHLKNLVVGEQIRFTDMDGNVFNYVVSQHETLYPSAVDEMKSGDWDLTLFTCTLGGEYRVTVRCVLDEYL